MKLLNIKRTLASERDEALRKAHVFMTAAEQDGRELSQEERASVQSHLDEAKKIKDRIEALNGDDELRAQISQFQGQNAPAGAAAPSPVVTDGAERGARRIASLGQQFVESQVYRDAIKGQSRPRGWRSGVMELALEPRAALLDSSGAGDLVVPQYLGGIREIRFERLTVADLLASGTTDSNAIIYMQETAATNGATAVAEGAAKPESALAFDSVTDLVKKIATWLPVTDEMLDDASQLRSYIDGRLRLFVQQEEEDQLLNGTGVGANITGLRNRTGLAADVARGTDNNMDAIFKQITAIATTAFIFPDGIVMNPANWQTVVLSKDGNGAYLAGGPFASPQAQRLWGLPVVSTTAMAAGVALVGAYQIGAQVFRKGGIAVETSNSHSDYFVKNLTAIRAEERLALAVYRPGAFGEVTGLA